MSNSTLNVPTDVALLLGRLDGKLDTIITKTDRLEQRVHHLEQRINQLEGAGKMARVIGHALAAVFGAIAAFAAKAYLGH